MGLAVGAVLRVDGDGEGAERGGRQRDAYLLRLQLPRGRAHCRQVTQRSSTDDLRGRGSSREGDGSGKRGRSGDERKRAGGRSNWQHLKEAYNELLKDIQWKVRRTLSYSIHEIALILGPELTKEALLPALDVFLKDLDEVKVGALQNLSKLLGVLEPAARSNYVSLICSLEMESDNWRFRQLLAQQLGELFQLFDESVVQSELYPIFMKLSRDPVAEVRNAAGQQLQVILERLDELKVTWREEFTEELQDLATDRVYLHRLMFAQMCENLLVAPAELDVDMFKKDFLPQLLVRPRVCSRLLASARLCSRLRGLEARGGRRTVCASRARACEREREREREREEGAWLRMLCDREGLCSPRDVVWDPTDGKECCDAEISVAKVSAGRGRQVLAEDKVANIRQKAAT
eukprot:827647-Rhodomonas_salina.2